MRPFQKVIAVVLAAILLLAAASCTPSSLTKQWSYKYSDDTLTTQQDIGVYIYALYQAYNQAETYARETKKYVEGEPFMDIKITDDDGDKAIARDWILEETKKIAVNNISLDYLLKKYDASYDEATLVDAEKEAQNAWDIGPYASYGYFNPLKAILEPQGVSFNSFFNASYVANVKQNALFAKLYEKGGKFEVSDKELTKSFKKKYWNYSYITINLYKNEDDGEGNTNSVPLKDKEIKAITNNLQSYVDKINKGDIKVSKALRELKKEYSVADDYVHENSVEPIEDVESNTENIAKELKKLKAGEATWIKTGDTTSSPEAFLIVKNDINDSVDEYIKNAEHRTSVLSTCKRDDFLDLIEKTTEDFFKSDALTENSMQINRYKADLFYVEPEPETEAETEEEHNHDHDSENSNG